MASTLRVWIAFLIGIALMGGSYYYLDAIYFAPASDVTIVSTGQDDNGKNDFSFVAGDEGTRLYSFDKTYMAVVTRDAVTIYHGGKPKETQHLQLDGKRVSFFEWVHDRNLAVLGLYGGDTPRTVEFKQFNPEQPDHMTGTEIRDLPRDSKITNVAYSTATNVIYMKVEVAPHAFRIYRTDANYDTRRIYVKATDIGRIAVFYDEDQFFYDNVETGDVFLYSDETGGWRTINPPGRYLLIGVGDDKTIYVAKVNKQNEALSVSEGKLGVGFREVLHFATPRPMSELSVTSVQQDIAAQTPTKPQ